MVLTLLTHGTEQYKNTQNKINFKQIFYSETNEDDDLSSGEFQSVITFFFHTFISKLCLTLQSDTSCIHI